MRRGTSGISTFYFRNHFRTRLYEKRPDAVFAVLYSKTACFSSRLRWQYNTFCSRTFAKYNNYNNCCLFTFAKCIQSNTFRSFIFAMCKHSTTLPAYILGNIFFYNVCCGCEHHRQSSKHEALKRWYFRLLPVSCFLLPEGNALGLWVGIRKPDFRWQYNTFCLGTVWALAPLQGKGGGSFRIYFRSTSGYFRVGG